MIDEEATFKKYNYRSTELTHGSNKKVVSVCDMCNKTRDTPFVRYRKLCPHCAIVNRAQRGPENIFWAGGSVELICKQCGNAYIVRRSHVGRSNFCSKKCQGRYRTEKCSRENSPLWNGGRVKKICVVCGEEYECKRRDAERSKFCSKKCQGIHKSKHNIGKNNAAWRGGKIELVCKQCEKLYMVPMYKQETSKFCSYKCRDIYRSLHCVGENSFNWKGGISYEPYCGKFNEAFKESVREKYGRSCYLCNKREEHNDQKLSVHHTNYDKGCMCNDVKCGFVPLCKGCHAKTQGDRFFWERLFTYALQYEENYYECDIPNLLIYPTTHSHL